ncbi:MAG: DUF4465 domain-containing protein [Planctomycetota bacterium]|nr:MAG: DUF4465 domain-containing protein [Planctomycetota bacterium]REK42425.1 MAG: DUF4465 domain-containing protein [Planctomycetota bacterium]
MNLKSLSSLLLTLLTCLVFAPATYATIADLEDIPLSPNSFDNGHPDGENVTVAGSMPPGGSYVDAHVSHGASFNVEGGVDAGFGFFFWSGWTVSSQTDTTTPGFGNQYTGFAGSGSEGSDNYAIGFTGGGATPTIQVPSGEKPIRLDVTNTTYAALSMLNGDAFAKQFGGPSGHDPDEFVLTITGNNGAGSIDVHLADYRFADNQLDYVLGTWLTVDISDLQDATELTFDLTTTDVGTFGPNTPLYFALDNFRSVGVLGDTDGDDDVDVTDILTSFANFTGPNVAPTPPTFGQNVADGDNDEDEDVDVTDILNQFNAFTGPLDEGGLDSRMSGPAAAGDPSIPDLIYDAATGEVVLDPDGSSIIGYSLQNATNSFLPGNHTPILAGVTTSLTSQLEEAALAPGSGSIGFVFPTGLDLAGLTSLLSVNQVSRSLGAPLVPFDLVVLNGGPAVPEPATWLLAAAGLVGLVAAGRRRKGCY